MPDRPRRLMRTRRPGSVLRGTPQEFVRIFAAAGALRKTLVGREPQSLGMNESRMNQTYRDWSPDQSCLFPPSPQDWLPEVDLVCFLLDAVAALDLTPIFAHSERELRGQPPSHPG